MKLYRSPQRGRYISSPQRELWVQVAKLNPARECERHNRSDGRVDEYVSPLRGSESGVLRLPTACAVGYKYFVGFANSFTLVLKRRSESEAAQPQATSALLFQKLIRDHQFLNLGSAFIDAQRAHISVEALDHGAAHETGAAVNLHSLIDDAPGRFGGKQFGLTRLAGRASRPCVFQISCAIDQQTSGVEFGSHVGQLRL